MVTQVVGAVAQTADDVRASGLEGALERGRVSERKFDGANALVTRLIATGR